jgi:1-deoxy-D-xylulose-5-phosphate reductoisomerase
MHSSPRHVAVLGATGSIGNNTLEVIAQSGGRLQAVALTAHNNLSGLLQQSLQFNPSFVALTDPAVAAAAKQAPWPEGTQLLTGPSALAEIAQRAEVDIVVAAVVGSAGLAGAWSALEAGKTLAIANKEVLVMAGPLVMELARARSATVLPIDSEHSAVHQAMRSGENREIRRIVLTASGGPFRRHTKAQLAAVTIDETLAHPTWRMGKKITVDSATMMNKALEIIEARWLFDLAPDQIEVVIHPQSIVHSMVEFVDGSTLAQLSPPDMKLPIQYALLWPQRSPSPATAMNWRVPTTLEFEPPDEERFPALRLGREVATLGGTAGAVLNAANEGAVARFLQGELRYHEIVPACEAVLKQHSFETRPTLPTLVKLDAWARQEIFTWR